MEPPEKFKKILQTTELGDLSLNELWAKEMGGFIHCREEFQALPDQITPEERQLYQQETGIPHWSVNDELFEYSGYKQQMDKVLARGTRPPLFGISWLPRRLEMQQI